MADNTGTIRPSNQSSSQKPLVGISFPFRKEDGEFPVRVMDTECVGNDFQTLFRIPQRSRIMKPRLGTTAAQAVFESQGSLLNARLIRIIRQAQANHEPRVKILGITLTSDGTEVTPKVDYVVQGVRDTATLPAVQTKG